MASKLANFHLIYSMANNILTTVPINEQIYFKKIKDLFHLGIFSPHLLTLNLLLLNAFQLDIFRNIWIKVFLRSVALTIIMDLKTLLLSKQDGYFGG